MKQYAISLCLWLGLIYLTLPAQAQEEPKDSTQVQKLLNKVSLGALVQMVGVGLQDRPTAAEEAAPDYSATWQRSFNIYRARILLGIQLTEKTDLFLETEIPTIIGRGTPDGQRRTQVRPIILDAQVTHRFSNAFSLTGGMQLVGITRNQLQSTASLLALDFGYFQYSYTLFETQALQNNFGRDVGINARGFLANDRLEYRLGVFNGRNFDGDDPFRFIARLNYNFWEREKDLYYTGTSLGTVKRLALGGGLDVQGSYLAAGADLFLDLPTGESGGLTLSAAFTYMTGGTANRPDSFTREIPEQTATFLELGYYFRKAKLLPYFKYENQDINAKLAQNTSSLSFEDFNTLNSNERVGLGLGYFFQGYNANLKLSYERVTYGRLTLDQAGAESNRVGEVWLQLQFFLF